MHSYLVRLSQSGRIFYGFLHMLLADAVTVAHLVVTVRFLCRLLVGGGLVVKTARRHQLELLFCTLLGVTPAQTIGSLQIRFLIFNADFWGFWSV